MKQSTRKRKSTKEMNEMEKEIKASEHLQIRMVNM